jgi:hypothetical protein
VNLWTQSIEPLTPVLDDRSHADLAALATQAIEGTYALFAPDYFPPSVALLITSATQDSRAAEWRLSLEYVGEFTAALDAVQDIPMRPGCGPLTMAVLGLVHGLAGELDSAGVQEILFSCYDSVLVSELTGLVTLAKEEANAQCLRAIAFQRDLISG